jgi:hypothetical protein
VVVRQVEPVNAGRVSLFVVIQKPQDSRVIRPFDHGYDKAVRAELGGREELQARYSGGAQAAVFGRISSEPPVDLR